MKKILLGFIAIGLLLFVGCDKDDDTDTETTDNQTVNNTQTNSNNSSDDSNKDSDDGTTEKSSGEAKDVDGYTYKTVIIGEQEWFAENLKTSKYSNGTSIPNVTDGSQWDYLSSGAWSHYDNDSSQYDTIYGKLYNWYAVETGKLCPTGWHVPTDADWTVLEDYLVADGRSLTEAGKALKSTTGWGSGNGTDDYGWNGLPGGFRYDHGYFDGIGYVGAWWSSSESSTGTSWYRYLSSLYDLVGRDYYGYKIFGNSVRCLRD